MPIEDRNLAAGTTLVATYKKERYTAQVIEAEEGDGVAFKLDIDGSVHKSPSAAASKVMDGASANGWRFWSIEGQEPQKKERPAKAEKKTSAKRTPSKNIRKIRKQDRSDEGLVGYFCSACQKGWYVDVQDGVPTECPEGHPADLTDELQTAEGDSPEADETEVVKEAVLED